MSKLWNNTFRAVNIALANEASCPSARPRASAGTASPATRTTCCGSCGRGRGRPLMDTATTAIAEQPARVLILGVACQPGAADLRESPALESMDRLTAQGATVEHTDPLVTSPDRPGAIRRSVDARGHLRLRHHSAQELYALSFRRRDGMVVLKRKRPTPGRRPGPDRAAPERTGGPRRGGPGTGPADGGGRGRAARPQRRDGFLRLLGAGPDRPAPARLRPSGIRALKQRGTPADPPLRHGEDAARRG
ncbi:UDP binding domain-containing protein [Streptomyces sp. NPDC088746]|uniref:UDP binding domain-containing protein n=1 Tax=Streptomyces sp. NPDC088746 TaxID=3365885 RepID=UPI003813F35A